MFTEDKRSSDPSMKSTQAVTIPESFMPEDDALCKLLERTRGISRKANIVEQRYLGQRPKSDKLEQAAQEPYGLKCKLSVVISDMDIALSQIDAVLENLS